MGEAGVRFRPLTRSDFPLLRGWLEEPLVARWWNHQTTDDAIENDFGGSVDGSDQTELFVVLTADRHPFGLIQRYPIAAYPEYVDELAPVVEVPDGALSLDYLIGDPACRGRGLAALAIRAFVADCWHAHPDAQDIVVPVSAGNRASWRSLENAGFVRVAEGDLVPDNPIDPPDHVVYRIRRTDLPGGGTAGVTAPGRQKGPPPTRG